MHRLIATAGLSLVILCGPAMAQEQAGTHDGSMMGMMNMRPGTEMSEAGRGYMKAMQSMMRNMAKMEMTGDPSGDFARMMIPHHQSAVDMADVLLWQKEIDPEIRKMAEKMKDEQTREIAELQKWLETHQR